MRPVGTSKGGHSVRIAFIGFGEAGRAFAGSLRQAGCEDLAAYDILFDSEGLSGPAAGAAAERGVAAAPSPAEAVAHAEWVVSAVTASSSLEAARASAPHLRAGHVFIDINSVSPGTKRAAAEAVAAGGARYLDMAVMGPVHPRGHRTPVLIAGPQAEALHPALARLGFSGEVVGEAPGEATAIKMVRSVFMKGLEAATVEMLMAARRAGCLERVLTSLADTYPGLDWQAFPGYQLERVSRHGVRRAAEMRESAAMLAELGLSGGFAFATAETQARIGGLGLKEPGRDLADALDRLLAALERAGGRSAA
jgi:3-hydroxyisobutyrate dehydrogenase-like beta-hydroxyacid dehydrogenase